MSADSPQKANKCPNSSLTDPPCRVGWAKNKPLERADIGKYLIFTETPGIFAIRTFTNDSRGPYSFLAFSNGPRKGRGYEIKNIYKEISGSTIVSVSMNTDKDTSTLECEIEIDELEYYILPINKVTRILYG